MKAKEVKISFLFIIPTLNSYKKLPKLINSFMEQEYEDWNIIFVDGKSTAKHKKWLKEICSKDNRIKTIPEKENSQGIYNAMNLGLKFVKKDNWTFFIGSDDWFFSRKSLKQIAKGIKNNIDNNLSLVISNGNIINIKTNKIKRKNKVPPYKLIDKKILYRLLFRGYVPAHQTVCFSYDILKQIKPYSEKYILASDLDMFLRLSLSDNLSRILFINKTTFNVGDGGISSRLTLRRFKEVTEIYLNYYGLKSFIPIFLRYFKKIFSRLINFMF